MKKVLNSQFWNEEVESSRTLDSVVYSLPQEPPPLALVRGGRLFRSQQLLLLQRFSSLPFVPSLSDGAFSLDRVIASAGGLHWWATLTARARIPTAFSLQREGGECNLFYGSQWMEKAKELLCQSLSVIGVCSRLSLGPNTFFNATCEANDILGYLLSCNHLSSGIWNHCHGQVSLRHKLRQHDVILKGAWNEDFLDRVGNYWTVPNMVSLDLVSAGCSALGIRYRVGLHHSSYGVAESIKEASMQAGLVPGIRGRAGVSIEKEVNLWKGAKLSMPKPYNLLASHPNITISGIIGGIFSANASSMALKQTKAVSLSDLGGIFSVDAFASIGLSGQFGHFQKPLLDFTKVSMRMDLSSASMLMKAALNSAQTNECNFPLLELSLQQQIAGPVRARIDTRLSADFFTPNKLFEMEELTYGIDCSLESLGAAKMVVWYASKRKEGMVELRFFEK